jgi:transposase-like protein
MWHITNQKYGANALGLQRVLGLGSYHTAWSWLHKFRRAMVRPGRDNLSGIVEIDETYIGGKSSGKRGRGADKKCLVAFAVEDKSPTSPSGKGIGRIRLKLIPDASAESLTAFIQEHITQGAHIRTDGWKGYQNLLTLGYGHTVVDSKALNIAHLTISLLKRWLLGTYQGAVRATHLEYYLDEFTFRFNRRTSQSRGKLFYRLVQQALLSDPVPNQQIAGDKFSRDLAPEFVTELHDVPF